MKFVKLLTCQQFNEFHCFLSLSQNGCDVTVTAHCHCGADFAKRANGGMKKKETNHNEIR